MIKSKISIKIRSTLQGARILVLILFLPLLPFIILILSLNLIRARLSVPRAPAQNDLD